MARDGDHLTLVSTGAMLATAMSAAEIMAAEGYRARVLSMHTIKPLDEDAVLRAAHETRLIITLEEHSIIGGLGGAVAELLCESDIPDVRFRRLGLPSSFEKTVGDQEYLRKLHGLDVESISTRILAILQQHFHVPS